MVQMQNNYDNIVIYNLVTIGATNVANSDGQLISAKENLQVNSHPFWTHVALFLPKASLQSNTPQTIKQGSDDDPNKELAKISHHL
jgi:hypothetical protein